MGSNGGNDGNDNGNNGNNKVVHTHGHGDSAASAPPPRGIYALPLCASCRREEYEWSHATIWRLLMATIVPYCILCRCLPDCRHTCISTDNNHGNDDTNENDNGNGNGNGGHNHVPNSNGSNVNNTMNTNTKATRATNGSNEDIATAATATIGDTGDAMHDDTNVDVIIHSAEPPTATASTRDGMVLYRNGHNGKRGVKVGGSIIEGLSSIDNATEYWCLIAQGGLMIWLIIVAFSYDYYGRSLSWIAIVIPTGILLCCACITPCVCSWFILDAYFTDVITTRMTRHTFTTRDGHHGMMDILYACVDHPCTSSSWHTLVHHPLYQPNIVQQIGQYL